MRVSLCCLCYKNFYEDEKLEGGAVEFSDYAPPPNGEVWLDDPPGIEWFCNEHLPAARALAYIPSQEALAELQRQFGVFPEPSYEPERLTWWQWLRSWFI